MIFLVKLRTRAHLAIVFKAKLEIDPWPACKASSSARQGRRAGRVPEKALQHHPRKSS